MCYFGGGGRGMRLTSYSLLHAAVGMSFFVFSTTMTFHVNNFWLLQKHEKVACNLPVCLPRKKDCSSIQNDSIEKFEIALDLQDLAVMFSVGEIPRRPSEPCSSHLIVNVVLGPRAVSLTQN